VAAVPWPLTVVPIDARTGEMSTESGENGGANAAKHPCGPGGNRATGRCPGPPPGAV